MRVLVALGALLTLSNLAAAQWEAVTSELVKSERPGYGGVSGVLVDRDSGAVMVWLSDKGLYQSFDHGQTWKAIGKTAKGRTETPGCIVLHTSGASASIIIPLVYGSPIIVTDKAGTSWTVLDKAATHVDWVAFDGIDSNLRFMLTLKHEAGGLLLASSDGGKSFREVDKNFGPAIIFDNKTAVIARIEPGEKLKSKKWVLQRTTDAAKTFQPVGEFTPKALPVKFDNAAYWLTDVGVIHSMDQGKSWKLLGSLKGGIFGPVFGKGSQQQFVLTGAGILESMDGGATWAKSLQLPAAMKGANSLSWLAYDSRADILYVMKMGSDLYRFRRGK